MACDKLTERIDDGIFNQALVYFVFLQHLTHGTGRVVLCPPSLLLYPRGRWMALAAIDVC